jgi:Gamma-aminobutyrate permease and related permeases
MGSVQMVTTVLKFAALLFVSIVGLFYINTANFMPWNISGDSAVAAIGAGMAIALFSYLGVEVASVAAGKVRDPDRNVPRSTVLRHARLRRRLPAVPDSRVRHRAASKLQESNAPFSTAVNTMFGGTWAGYVMAVVVIISGFGALNGWTMICAEMPLAAAKDGLFPERFKHISKNGVPVYGIIASTVLASIAMAINYIGSGGAQVFTTLVLMTGITSAIPYGSPRWRRSNGVLSTAGPCTASDSRVT